MDSVKRAAAEAEITAFAGRASPTLWPTLQKSLIVQELRQRLANPNLINQSATNVCGIASVCRFWLEDSPVDYVNFAIGLYEIGTGILRRDGGDSKQITPSVGLRSDTAPAGMPHVDWLMMASIREAYNGWFSYRSPNASWIDNLLEPLRAINLPSDVERGLRETGYTRIFSNTAWWSGKPIYNAQEASYRLTNDNARVILLIHSNMLYTATEHLRGNSFLRVSTSNHWIGLLSPIKISPGLKDYKGGPVLEPFQVFSWGSVRWVPEDPVHDIPLSVEDFCKNYYGFIAAQW